MNYNKTSSKNSIEKLEYLKEDDSKTPFFYDEENGNDVCNNKKETSSKSSITQPYLNESFSFSSDSNSVYNTPSLKLKESPKSNSEKDLLTIDAPFEKTSFEMQRLSCLEKSKISWEKEACFFSDGIRIIDYVLAYEDERFNAESDIENEQVIIMDEKETGREYGSIKKTKAVKRRIFQENLIALGLDIEEMPSHFYSSNKIIFVLIHAPFHVLCKQAEILKLKMPIIHSEEVNQVNFFDGWLDTWLIKKFRTTMKPELERRFEIKPKFRSPFIEERIECFENCHDPDNFFPRAERSRLVYDLLLRTKYNSEESSKCQIGIERMISRGIYYDAFPLHEPLRINKIILSTKETLDKSKKQLNINETTDRELLYKYWASLYSFWRLQPLDLIKRYFGTKIGIYFAWLGYYTKSLIWPSMIGLIIVLIAVSTSINDIPSNDVCSSDGIGEKVYLCPTCEKYCNFQKLRNNCVYAKLTYIFDNYYTVIFAVVMCLWGTLFLEGWKRFHSEIAYKWGMLDFEVEDETMRPDFQSKIKTKRINPVSKEEEPWLPRKEKLFRWFCSGMTVLFFICLVIAFAVGVIIYRVSFTFSLYGSDNEFYRNNAIIITSLLAGFINVCFIMILNRCYNWLAFKLTVWECPRTQTDFDNSYALKVFLFQFVNYYTSLFYIAFFKGRFNSVPNALDKTNDDTESTFRPSLEQCDPSGCMVELVIQLGTIMIGKQMFTAIIERLLPKFYIWFASLKNKSAKKKPNGIIPNKVNPQKEDKVMNQCDLDYSLNQVHKQYLFDEYLEMVIQFGFVTLFVTAFPLAPMFALLNNFIEVRIDAQKFICTFRRPMPAHAKNIGVWEGILSGISYTAVLVNACIIAFTSDFIPKLYYLFFKSNGDLQGYMDYSLSYFDATLVSNSTIYNDVNICRFRGFYRPTCKFMEKFPKITTYKIEECSDDYNVNDDWWKMMVMRCAFVLIFEHFVFALKVLIAYIIPDIPTKIVYQIQRERHLSRKAMLNQHDFNFNKKKKRLYQKLEKLKNTVNASNITNENKSKKSSVNYFKKSHPEMSKEVETLLVANQPFGVPQPENLSYCTNIVIPDVLETEHLPGEVHNRRISINIMRLLISMILPIWKKKEKIAKYNQERLEKIKSLKNEVEKALEDNYKICQILDGVDYQKLKELLLNGHVTPIDVLNYYQNKAILANEDVNCVCEFIEKSKEIAIYLTSKYNNYEERKKLPLYGIPVSIKECEQVAGCRNTLGYAYNLDNISNKDGSVMNVLIKAGAIPFVTTNVPQSLLSFSCSNPIYGVTRNPHKLTHTPGGSSGGEGALIAKDGSIIGIGGDVGGSIRIPAAYTGICGIKPSHLRFCSYPSAGSVPGRPLINASAGPMSKHVDGLIDICRIFFNASKEDIIRNVDPYTVPVPWDEEQFQSKNKVIKVGMYTYDGFFECLPAVKRAVEEAGDYLRQMKDENGKEKYSVKLFYPPNIPEAFGAFLKAVSVDGGEYLINNFKNDIILPEYKKILFLLNLPIWLRKVAAFLIKPFSYRYSLIATSVPTSTGDLRKTYEFIEKYRYKFVEQMKEEDIDVLLLPPNGTHAMPHDKPLEMIPVISYTGIFNLLDFGAGVVTTSKVNENDIANLETYKINDRYNNIAKNIGKDGFGLPLGVQVAAPPFKEETVLRVMKDIETMLHVN
uniref:Anoctamin n=1 Tax=Strongyloides stercoralis TaxID=6248 RepID=A0A913HJ60_STRER